MPTISSRVRIAHLIEYSILGKVRSAHPTKLIHSPQAGVFSVLRDETLFAQAHIALGAVTWPGELDLAPDAMHQQIRECGEWVIS